MDIHALPIPGAYEFVARASRDERGFFARVIDTDELKEVGLQTGFVQESVAYNIHAGTLRGLHYQASPAWETKIVSCFSGAAFDVILDLRSNSPMFGQWAAVTLDAERCNAVYIPEGCAHGYQALTDGTLLHYKISPAYVADLARGVNALDQALAIPWPLPRQFVSQRDSKFPTLTEHQCEFS